jgi:hypothetical protein
MHVRVTHVTLARTGKELRDQYEVMEGCGYMRVKDIDFRRCEVMIGQYRIDKKTIQRGIKNALRQTAIIKPASSYTLRCCVRSEDVA